MPGVAAALALQINSEATRLATDLGNTIVSNARRVLVSALLQHYQSQRSDLQEQLLRNSIVDIVDAVVDLTPSLFSRSRVNTIISQSHLRLPLLSANDFAALLPLPSLLPPTLSSKSQCSFSLLLEQHPNLFLFPLLHVRHHIAGRAPALFPRARPAAFARAFQTWPLSTLVALFRLDDAVRANTTAAENHYRADLVHALTLPQSDNGPERHAVVRRRAEFSSALVADLREVTTPRRVFLRLCSFCLISSLYFTLQAGFTDAEAAERLQRVLQLIDEPPERSEADDRTLHESLLPPRSARAGRGQIPLAADEVSSSAVSQALSSVFSARLRALLLDSRRSPPSAQPALRPLADGPSRVLPRLKAVQFQGLQLRVITTSTPFRRRRHKKTEQKAAEADAKKSEASSRRHVASRRYRRPRKKKPRSEPDVEAEAASDDEEADVSEAAPNEAEVNAEAEMDEEAVVAADEEDEPPTPAHPVPPPPTLRHQPRRAPWRAHRPIAHATAASDLERAAASGAPHQPASFRASQFLAAGQPKLSLKDV